MLSHVRLPLVGITTLKAVATCCVACVALQVEDDVPAVVVAASRDVLMHAKGFHHHSSVLAATIPFLVGVTAAKDDEAPSGPRCHIFDGVASGFVSWIIAFTPWVSWKAPEHSQSHRLIPHRHRPSHPKFTLLGLHFTFVFDSVSFYIQQFDTIFNLFCRLRLRLGLHTSKIK